MHHFGSTWIILCWSLSYPFPLSSLMSFPIDSSSLGLLVVPAIIPNELNSMLGLNP